MGDDGESLASGGTGNTGHEQPQKRRSTRSDAVRPTQQARAAAPLRNANPKQGAVQQGGKQGTKGAPSVTQALNLFGRQLTRHTNEIRQWQKETQLVVDLDQIDSVIDLRRDLVFITEKWRSERPSRGRRPDGDLHVLLWTALLESIKADHVPEVGEVSHEISAMPSHAYWATILPVLLDAELVAMCTAFHPFGSRRKTSEPDGTWHWALRLVANTTRQREVRESLYVHLGAIVPGVTIREDRGSFDQLARDIAALRF